MNFATLAEAKLMCEELSATLNPDDTAEWVRKRLPSLRVHVENLLAKELQSRVFYPSTKDFRGLLRLVLQEMEILLTKIITAKKIDEGRYIQPDGMELLFPGVEEEAWVLADMRQILKM